MLKSILILQTTDGVQNSPYKKMVDLTQPYHIQYCTRYHYQYRRYDGICFGTKEWNATFNRIFLLNDILTNEIQIDWVLYIDADCILCNQEMELESFLDSNYAIIACAGNSDLTLPDWCVNIGIAFYNMKHRWIQRILKEWKSRFFAEALRKQCLQDDTLAFINSQNRLCDQTLLHSVLARCLLETPSICKSFKGRHTTAFNYNGTFIKHFLRSRKSFETTEELYESFRQWVERVV